MALEFPPIYLLKCGFEKIPHELYKLETQIGVVWDIREADIVLGRLQTKTKANHELRKLGLHTEEVNNVVQEHKDPRRHIGYQSSNKRKVDEAELDGNETISLSETELSGPTEPKASSSLSTGPSIVRTRLPMGENGGDASTIKVLKCAWYVDSLKAGKLLPQDKYLVFEGRIINPAIQARVPTLPQSNPLSEARADPSLLSNEKLFSQHGIHGPRAHPTQTSKQPATLIHETTEDNDNLPPIPKYLHTRFCCERPTPLHCPNETFLSQLRIIKKGRLLRGDEIGVRAYSAAIATVASYPHIVTSPFEIKRLPNCGDKIATVWQQWRDTGHAQEAEIYEADEKFQVMSLFYNIHDVGYKRALKFWDNGWRNLDDIVEQGVSSTNYS
jgi:DNA polymerase IV